VLGIDSPRVPFTCPRHMATADVMSAAVNADVPVEHMATADAATVANADVPVELMASADAATIVNTDVVSATVQPAWTDVDLESGGTDIKKRSFCTAGAISDAETAVLASQKTIHTLRRREMLWIAVVVFLVCGMFCTTVIAVHVTKEMHVQDSRLVDSDGSAVFTRTQVDSIEGVELPEGRRLSGESNITRALQEDEIANESAMEIGLWFFKRTRNAYRLGQTEWVVKLPDDTARTVHIQGASQWKAWGKCGDCRGNMRWLVRCENEARKCSISWRRIEEVQAWTRRMSGDDDVEAALLARAGAKAPAGDDEEEAETRSMERSLGGKQCA